MLNHGFVSSGFCYIKPDFYLNNDNFSSIHDLKKLFDTELEADGSEWRKRAYLKLIWSQKDNQINLATNQNYFQTAQSNQTDGGKIRKFKVMPKETLDIAIVQNILKKNLQLVSHTRDLLTQDDVTIGLHFIRYQVTEHGASYSSPDWLHQDDEPLVFIHLVNLSKTALGGDNLIADCETKKITNVIRLEHDFETLVVNKSVYHAVTPLGSKSGVATRDVILFTVEPQTTQAV